MDHLRLHNLEEMFPACEARTLECGFVPKHMAQALVTGRGRCSLSVKL